MTDLALVDPGILERSGAKITPTSLELLNGDLAYEDYEALGAMLGQIYKGTRFWIGDWCKWGERRYGETYAQALTATGLSYDALTNYAWVAGQVQSSRRRELLSFSHHAEVASLQPAQQTKWLDRAEEHGWTREELRAAMKGRGMEVHYSSENDEWETPQALFDLLDAEFTFNTDVCATTETAKCEHFFPPEEDGLVQEWEGTCWMNPPYGDVIVDWVQKAWMSAQAGATVVCLLPARVDTGWWWNYARFGEVRFLRGRLRFGGGGDMGAPFPSAVVVFGRSSQVIWWEAWPV